MCSDPDMISETAILPDDNVMPGLKKIADADIRVNDRSRPEKRCFPQDRWSAPFAVCIPDDQAGIIISRGHVRFSKSILFAAGRWDIRVLAGR